jgi:glycerol-3-phosphate cytidylyltransferase-like family protein
MKKKLRIYKNAVTFGRMNISHRGHVELVQKMLEIADVANVYLSSGKKNTDWDLRVLMLRHLLREGGVDLRCVNILKASNPFSAVENMMETDNDAVVVLGEDQYELANKLCADYHLGGQLNRRTGSSTQVRHLLDHGDLEDVRYIYRGDGYAVRLAAMLRREERQAV